MLEVKIEENAIIIKLPIEILIFATENCEELATFDEIKDQEGSKEYYK
jgi:hypothetical protein